MLGFYVFKYSLYSIIYLGIIAAGIVNHKILETVALFVCYVNLRYCFPTTFHDKNVYHCVFWSIVLFWIAVPHTLPLSVSLFSSVIVGFSMTYALYFIQDYIDLKIFHRKHTSFTLETATKEQIVDCCKILHYKKDKIDLALKFFVERLDNELVWNYLLKNKKNVDLDTVRQYRYRIKKDLSRFVDTQ